MWGCEWEKLRQDITVPQRYRYPLEDRVRLTEAEIITGIEHGLLFGALECDIAVPEHLRTVFEEMTPIFKNIDVTENDIGDYMQDYLKQTEQSFPTTRYLIGSMFGTKILLITPLAKWYLSHGLVITKVYQFIQFNPVKCFEPFADNVTSDRREGNILSHIKSTAY